MSRQWFTGSGSKRGHTQVCARGVGGGVPHETFMRTPPPVTPLKTACKKMHWRGCGIGTFKRFRGYVVFRLDFSHERLSERPFVVASNFVTLPPSPPPLFQSFPIRDCVRAIAGINFFGFISVHFFFFPRLSMHAPIFATWYVGTMTDFEIFAWLIFIEDDPIFWLMSLSIIAVNMILMLELLYFLFLFLALSLLFLRFVRVCLWKRMLRSL